MKYCLCGDGVSQLAQKESTVLGFGDKPKCMECILIYKDLNHTKMKIGELKVGKCFHVGALLLEPSDLTLIAELSYIESRKSGERVVLKEQHRVFPEFWISESGAVYRKDELYRSKREAAESLE